jgi:hypothetical protein
MDRSKEEDKKEHERKRKEAWRAKQAAIKDGSYQATPIEQAKSFLEMLEDPEVDAVYNDPLIGALIKQEDRRVLSNFVYHLKSRRNYLIE